MSLPPIPRPKPAASLPDIANVPATRKEARRPQVQAPAPETIKPTKEILAITVEDDPENSDAISVSFAGAGFDVENDEIVLDLLRLAVNSYGYDIFELPDV